MHEAGAILLGKLALHEFATGGPAFDLPWPPARNPWNRDLHPGGSSSGSGAALAAGLAPATLGTDTGGSVRNPATCCGIVGMKPTYGAVSLSGVFPLTYSLDHVGPMTRGVEDNAILLHAIAGHDPDDPTMTKRPLADCLKDMKAGLKGMTIGVIEHFYTKDAPADPDQVRGIENAIEVLQQARRRGAHHPGLAAAAVDRLQPHHPRLGGLRDPRARPAGAAGGLRAADPQPHHARRVRLGGEIHQGAAAARRAVQGDGGGDARPRRGDHAVEPAAALQDRRHRRGAQDLRPAVPAGVQRHRRAVRSRCRPDCRRAACRSPCRSPRHAFDEPTVYRIAHAYCEAAGTIITADPKTQPRLVAAPRTAAAE